MRILHWLNKNQAIKTVSQCAYRLLEEVPALLYGDTGNRNLLIQGDNNDGLHCIQPILRSQNGYRQNVGWAEQREAHRYR